MLPRTQRIVPFLTGADTDGRLPYALFESFDTRCCRQIQIVVSDDHPPWVVLGKRGSKRGTSDRERDGDHPQCSPNMAAGYFHWTGLSLTGRGSPIVRRRMP